MLTLINSTLQSIRNNPIAVDFLPETNQKYAKIAVAVSVALLALTTIFWIYRHYKAKELSPDDSNIPSHLNPNNTQLNLNTSTKKKGSIKKDPIKKDPIKKDPIKKDPIKKDPIKKASIKQDPIKKDDQDTKAPAPKKSGQEVVNGSYARELQQQYFDDENLPSEKNDEELSMELIAKLIKMDLEAEDANARSKSKPIHHPVIHSPNPSSKTHQNKSQDELTLELIAQMIQEDLDKEDAKKSHIVHPNPTPILNPNPTPILNPNPTPILNPNPSLDSPVDLDSPLDLNTPPASPSPKKIEKIVELPKILDVDSPKEKPKAQPSPFDQIEDICAEISENVFSNLSFSAVNALSVVDSKMKTQIESLLNEIVKEFEKRNPHLNKLAYGDPVPEYFANVQGSQSKEERKYLSLAGIRNLFKYGPRFIDDFSKKRFLGGEHHYNLNEGLKAFKYYTGNAVDLDTEIDVSNDQDAIKQAEQMIIKFGKLCSLKKTGGGELTADEVAQQLPKRKLNLPLPGGHIHDVGQNNLDRSNHGIWKRTSPGSGKSFYYVNVPNPDIVLVATLRMPYLLAELAYRVKEKNNGNLPKEFFDEFFDKGLSTMCFNDKARTFLDFYHIWNAKLNGDVIDPKEDARRKLAKGVFGEELRKKNPDAVLAAAFTQMQLTKLLEANPNYECKGRSFEKFVADTQVEMINELKSKGHWESALYHSEDGDDYFLLNQGTLDLFMKVFYEYMQTMDII